MDDRLFERLKKIEQSIDEMRDIETRYLTLEGNKKALLAQLTIKAPGKSFAEREAHALASDEWRDFNAGLVEAEVAFNHARRFYELRLKAFDAAYLSLKTETPAIRRQSS